jgi:AAA domain
MWGQSCKFGVVGKTTVSIEISTALARFYGKRTLLVDLDPQASATFYVMEQNRWAQWKDANGSTYELFKRRNLAVHKAIVRDVLRLPAELQSSYQKRALGQRCLCRPDGAGLPFDVWHRIAATFRA